jgi:hypothetical protein
MSFLRALRGMVRRSAPRGNHSRRLAVEALEDRTLPSTLTVLNNLDSGDGSLRAMIAAASDGDTINFDRHLRGQTITLTSGELAITKSLDIEGLGADQLAVSGNHASRVFNISGGVTVTIAGLTITDGHVVGGPARGGAIFMNAATNLTVANDILSNNEALGLVGNGNASSGAIDDVQGGATLTVTHCQFLHNLARGTFQANSGAINSQGSNTTITDSTFIGNQAIGGDGGTSGFSRAGAVYNGAVNNATGTMTVANCTFIGNQVLAGSNNTGAAGTFGGASGGAMQNSDGGILFLTGSLFSGNQSIGGSNNTSTGGIGNVGSGSGGGLSNVGVATVTDTVFEDNEARGGSGNTGDGTSFELVGTGTGGAISTGAGNTSDTPVTLILSNVTLRSNRAVGGDGNTAGTLVGEGIGGGLASNGANAFATTGGSRVTISNSTIADNQAAGGQGADGSNGGDAQGGGLANFFGGSSPSRAARSPATRPSAGRAGPVATAAAASAAVSLTRGHQRTPPTPAPRPSSRSWIAGSRAMKPRAAAAARAATAWEAASTSPAATRPSP